MKSDKRAVAELRDLNRQGVRLRTGLRARSKATEDQAVEELIALREQEEQGLASLGEVAFRMGDVCLRITGIPESNAALRVALQTLSERTGISVSMLEDRRFTCSRIPEHARDLGAARYSVYQEIARLADPDERKEYLNVVLSEEPPVAPGPRASRGRWTVNALRRRRGVRTTQPPANPIDHVRQATPEQRRQILRDLAADPEVLIPVVNDRKGGIASEIERAVHSAAGDFHYEQLLRNQEIRQHVREQEMRTMLSAPTLSNQLFLHRMSARVLADAQRYNVLAHDLLEPMLRAHPVLLADMRPHFRMLIDAAQRCLDILPEMQQDGTIVNVDIPEGDIDARYVPAVEQFMLTTLSEGDD